MKVPGRRRRPRSALRDPYTQARGRRVAAGERDSEGGVGILRGGARPPIQVLNQFVEEHREEFGVEPICRVLTENGIPTAPSTDHEARNR